MAATASTVAGVRPNQRLRTRKDLLTAAARLMKQGRSPSLEEVAEAALVSRATAYRHFPNVEALLVEASLDVAFPDADELFRGNSGSARERLHRADAAVDRMIEANEQALRTLVAHSLRRPADAADTEPRQNRRTPLIEAALEPLRDRIAPDVFDRLVMALALVIGTEAMLVFKDVLGVDAATARGVRRWTIDALVTAATGDAHR